MAIVDKSKLLARRVAEDTVEIEGLGEVAVRGVTRYELLSAGKGVNEEKVPDLIERRMLVAGVAEPELTMAEAEEWQKSAVAGVTPSRWARAVKERAGASPRARSAVLIA